MVMVNIEEYAQVVDYLIANTEKLADETAGNWRQFGRMLQVDVHIDEFHEFAYLASLVKSGQPGWTVKTNLSRSVVIVYERRSDQAEYMVSFWAFESDIDLALCRAYLELESGVLALEPGLTDRINRIIG